MSEKLKEKLIGYLKEFQKKVTELKPVWRQTIKLMGVDWQTVLDNLSLSYQLIEAKVLAYLELAYYISEFLRYYL